MRGTTASNGLLEGERAFTVFSAPKIDMSKFERPTKKEARDPLNQGCRGECNPRDNFLIGCRRLSAPNHINGEK